MTGFLTALAATAGVLLVVMALASLAQRVAEGHTPLSRARRPAPAERVENLTNLLTKLFWAYAFVVIGGGVILAGMAAPVVFREFLAAGDAGSIKGAGAELLDSFGPAALVVAGFVAVLSIPLVLFRAYIQQRQTEVQAKQQRTAESNLEEARDSAKRADVTQRYLRAIELLGASAPVTRVETKTVKDILIDPQGQTREITREVPVQVTEQAVNIETRLGAIYALEKVARDNVEDYHWPIMETLLAYIRERRPLLDLEAERIAALGPRPAYNAPAADRIAYGTKTRAWWEQRRKTFEKPPEDVAAIIALILRRSDAQLAHEGRLSPDGAWTDWPAFLAATPKPDDNAPAADRTAWAEKLRAWAEATPARDPDYDLSATPLWGADLRKLDWRRPNLRAARLEGAHLHWARLEGANLWRAGLEGADLRRAGLEGANLSGAGLEGADLSEARLEGADLSEARLEGAFLWRADFGALKEGERSSAAGSPEHVAGDPAAEEARWPKELTQDQLTQSLGDKTAWASIPDGLKQRDGLSMPAHWDWETDDFTEATQRWEDFKAQRAKPSGD